MAQLSGEYLHNISNHDFNEDDDDEDDDDDDDYHNDVPKRVPKRVFISRLASYAPIIMLLFSAFNNMTRKW